MPLKLATVCTITKDGTTYRFTDIYNHGTHWTGKQVLDNGKLGSMVHKITKQEMESATITAEDINV